MTGGVPLLVDVAGLRVVTVGAGPVAAVKTAPLVEAGADVVVVAPEAVLAIRDAAAAAHLTWHARAYHTGDLDGAYLVIAATADAAVNAQVAVDAAAQSTFCVRTDRVAGTDGPGTDDPSADDPSADDPSADDPSADDPSADDPSAGNRGTGNRGTGNRGNRGTVAMLAAVRRGELLMAVSTGGRAPAVARHVRTDLERAFGPEYGDLVELVADLRGTPEVRQRLGGLPGPSRRAAWRSLPMPDILRLLRNGDIPSARELALACLCSSSD